jgi:hypothetical protein
MIIGVHVFVRLAVPGGMLVKLVMIPEFKHLLAAIAILASTNHRRGRTL